MASNEFVSIVIQGTTYLIPKPSAPAPYGEELFDYLQALGSAYSTLVGVGDIQETSATLLNNQSSSADVLGLSFDSAQVRSASIAYQITRTTNLSNRIESGFLNVFYDASRSINNKWVLQRESIGVDSLVEFTITDSGQVQYTTDNMSGTGYSGMLKFEARALLQT